MSSTSAPWVSYWGPREGQGFARRLRLDGPDVLSAQQLPRAAEDSLTVWDLLQKVFLAVHL